ncbi:MAG: InlB B-repeat-containing protein [Fibrobacterales bacterium]
MQLKILIFLLTLLSVTLTSCIGDTGSNTDLSKDQNSNINMDEIENVTLELTILLGSIEIDSIYVEYLLDSTTINNEEVSLSRPMNGEVNIELQIEKFIATTLSYRCYRSGQLIGSMDENLFLSSDTTIKTTMDLFPISFFAGRDTVMMIGNRIKFVPQLDDESHQVVYRYDHFGTGNFTEESQSFYNKEGVFIAVVSVFDGYHTVKDSVTITVEKPVFSGINSSSSYQAPDIVPVSSNSRIIENNDESSMDHFSSSSLMELDDSISIALSAISSGGVIRFAIGNTLNRNVIIGQDVNVKATPDSGYVFKGWSGGEFIDLVSEENTVTCDADCVITGQFVRVFSLSYNAKDTEVGYPQDKYGIEHQSSVRLGGDVTQLKKSGYSFDKWIDQDGNEYEIGDELLMPEKDLVITAVWSENPTYGIIYSAPSITSGSVPIDNALYEEKELFAVLDKGTMAKRGYVFSHWLESVTYTVGKPYEMPAGGITLTANWVSRTNTVTFSKNDGGSVAVKIEYKATGSILPPTGITTPTRTSYLFSGNWCVDESCRKMWDFNNDTVNSDTVLYAHWVQKTVTNITLNKSIVHHMTVNGNEEQLDASLEPLDLLNRNVLWRSSNTKVVTVDASGKVSAVGIGFASISVIADDNNSYIAECDFTVDSLLDERDNQVYGAVAIGTQIWMSENLNFASSRSVCHGGQVENCDKYGRLYTWSSAMNISQLWDNSNYTSILDDFQGSCPVGWHIPTDDEWKTMIDFAKQNAPAGESLLEVLKSTTGWTKSTPGTDRFGFSVLPAGNDHCIVDYRCADFWSSTQSGSVYAKERDFTRDIERAEGYIKTAQYSMRCVQN